MPSIGNITFELTHRCHRRCTFCYLPALRAANADPGDELGVKEIVDIARTIMRSSGCRRIQLSGGEPLLRHDLLEIIAALRAEGAAVAILSDGAPLDASLASALKDAGVKVIQPTLLSPDATLHDALRGRGSFRDVTRAIAVAAAHGLPVSVSMVVMRPNYAQAGAVAELAFALGARGLALSRYCPSSRDAFRRAELMPDAAQVGAAALDAAQRCRALGLPLSAAITIPRCVWPNPDNPPLRSGLCSLVGPKATVTVGPDGAVRSCSLSTSPVGNIRSEPWSVLWARLVEGELAPLAASPPTECAPCKWLEQCRGGCRMAALAASGLRTAADPLASLATP